MVIMLGVVTGSGAYSLTGLGDCGLCFELTCPVVWAKFICVGSIISIIVLLLI